METISIDPTFEAWLYQARRLLSQGTAPDSVLWSDQADEVPLFGAEVPPPNLATTVPRVPKAFLDLAQTVAAHTDSQRWTVLYRVLWRLTRGREPHLLSLATDPEVRQLERWRKLVSREIHKLHAFVRFRLVGASEATGREQFVAWFEPLYRTVRLAAPFFQRRFTGMDWSILTPEECVHWDGWRLHFTPGVPHAAAPDADALEGLWRTYYQSIFNPARLKVNAMQAEMPKKYWKNLPEAPLIAELIATSQDRVQTMLNTPERPAKPAPKNAYLERLRCLPESSLSEHKPPSKSQPQS